jgi:hypothetical protein
MKYILTLIAVFAMTLPGVSSAAQIAQKNPVFPIKAFVGAEASVVESRPTMGLYLLTFSLTATGEDVFLPVRPLRNSLTASIGSVGALYSIHESDAGEHTGGIAGAFLWSKGGAEDGYYAIDAGDTREFTLVVIYENTGVETDHYQVRLDGLRYSLSESSNTVVPEVNGFEQYKTKEVELTK